MLWLPLIDRVIQVGGGILLAAVALAIPIACWTAQRFYYGKIDQRNEHPIRIVKTTLINDLLDRSRKEE